MISQDKFKCSKQILERLSAPKVFFVYLCGPQSALGTS